MAGIVRADCSPIEPDRASPLIWLHHSNIQSGFVMLEIEMAENEVGVEVLLQPTITALSHPSVVNLSVLDRIA